MIAWDTSSPPCASLFATVQRRSFSLLHVITPSYGKVSRAVWLRIHLLRLNETMNHPAPFMLRALCLWSTMDSVGHPRFPCFHHSIPQFITYIHVLLHSFHTIIPSLIANSFLTLHGWLSLVFLYFLWLKMILSWFTNDGFAKFICHRVPSPKFFTSKLN